MTASLATAAMSSGEGLNAWGSSSTNYTRTQVNGAQAVTTFSAGEVCRMNGFVTSSNSTITEQLVDCASD